MANRLLHARTRTLWPAQLDVLVRLGTVLQSLHYYLAGGVGVALHLGHRRSYDLDWFRSQALQDPSEVVRGLSIAAPDLHVERTAPGTVVGRMLGVQVSLFDHEPPLLEPPLTEPDLGTEVASLDDLIAMKLVAIQNRGEKRDFIDLYCMLQATGLGLSEALGRLDRRYHGDPYTATRALAYFDDADRAPDLALLHPVDWPEVKAFFRREVGAWWRDR